MSLYKYFRISKPSPDRVPEDRVDAEYKRLRSRTFWGASVVYSLYYVCRMTLSVVKQPLIDGGVLSAGDLGLIGSALLLVYAFGKFVNGFIADYCNIRRFMAVGLFVSAVVNLLMGLLGLLGRGFAIPGIVVLVAFFILWGANGWVQSMGAPPGIINLSRWFPLSKRGTYYSIFSSTPYIGKFLTFILTGVIVGALGWEWGFIFAAAAGFAGTAIALFFISDTPESKGLPSIQELSGEKPAKTDSMPTRELQKIVLRQRIRLYTPICYKRLGSAFPAEGQGFLPPGGDTDNCILRGVRSGRYHIRRLAFRHCFPWRPGEAGSHIGNRLLRCPAAFPVHRRRLSDEYFLRICVQPVHRCSLLHRSRADGRRHCPEEGHRCCSRHCRHIQLRRCCHPGCRYRLSH